MSKQGRVKLDWGPHQAVGPDGTRYMVQGEELRGEPKWFSAHYLPPGVRDWKNVPIGEDGHREGPQKTRCRRFAEQRLRESEGASHE